MCLVVCSMLSWASAGSGQAVKLACCNRWPLQLCLRLLQPGRVAARAGHPGPPRSWPPTFHLVSPLSAALSTVAAPRWDPARMPCCQLLLHGTADLSGAMWILTSLLGTHGMELLTCLPCCAGAPSSARRCACHACHLQGGAVSAIFSLSGPLAHLVLCLPSLLQLW